ncbi:hypothetical protein AX17_005561 [Amanita inopinata Kibby_2008]|nr:hypothetical protein AX17_005561 [Amanita inopinata Kibby_2008]
MSFGTDNHQNSPPLLLEDMEPQYHLSRRFQRTYATGSYSSENYPQTDPRPGRYSPQVASHPAIVSRHTSEHPDVSAALSDQQFIMPTHPHATASLFSSPSQPLDMQHQQHLAPPPQGWTPYDQTLGIQSGMALQFNSYPSSSPYPPPRLAPPPINNTSGSSLNGGPGVTLAGSLDPATGIFYRTPEHPRLRTAQACEKCRTRKAKCSGEHPTCKRCQNRGLVCEYAKEGRVRGPNKPKNKAAVTIEESRSYPPRSKVISGSTGFECNRTPDQPDLSLAVLNALREQDKRVALSASSVTSLSLGEHRSTRPRPPNLKLETSSNYRREDPYHQAGIDFQLQQSVQSPLSSLPHHERFRFGEDPGTIHNTSQIPMSYQEIHMQTPTGLSIDDIETKVLSYSCEENRSPSTSSSASMQGHHPGPNQPMLHPQNAYIQGLAQQSYRGEHSLRVDRSPTSSIPSAMVFATSNELTTSPSIPTPPIIHYSGHNGNGTVFETLHPDHQSPSHMKANALPLSLVSIWSDVANKSDFTGLTFGNDGRPDGQNGMSVQGPHQGLEATLHHSVSTPGNGVRAPISITGSDATVCDNHASSHMHDIFPVDFQMH